MRWLARAITVSPASSGWRSASSTLGRNSGIMQQTHLTGENDERSIPCGCGSLLTAELRCIIVKSRSAIDSLAADIVNGRMGTESLTKAEIDELLDRLSASTPDSFDHQKAADAVIAALHRYKRYAADPQAAPTRGTPEPSKKIP